MLPSAAAPSAIPARRRCLQRQSYRATPSSLTFTPSVVSQIWLTAVIRELVRLAHTDGTCVPSSAFFLHFSSAVFPASYDFSVPSHPFFRGAAARPDLLDLAPHTGKPFDCDAMRRAQGQMPVPLQLRIAVQCRQRAECAGGARAMTVYMDVNISHHQDSD